MALGSPLVEAQERQAALWEPLWLLFYELFLLYRLDHKSARRRERSRLGSTGSTVLIKSRLMPRS